MADHLDIPLTQSADENAERRKELFGRHLTIAIFVTSMLIPASYGVYSFYTGVARTRSPMQELFFHGFTITVTVAILVSFASLVLYYYIPTRTPHSMGSPLSWASGFTFVSLITMMLSFICAWLSVLDDPHSYVVLSVTGISAFALLLMLFYSII